MRFQNMHLWICMFDCCICSSSGSSSTTTHPHTLSITKTIHTSIHGSDSTRVCTQVKCNNMSTEWRRNHHQQQQNHLYSHRAPLETQRTSDCKINPHNDTTPHLPPTTTTSYNHVQHDDEDNDSNSSRSSSFPFRSGGCCCCCWWYLEPTNLGRPLNNGCY